MSFIRHEINRGLIDKNLNEFDLAYEKRQSQIFWDNISTLEKVIFVASCLTIFGGIGYGAYLHYRATAEMERLSKAEKLIGIPDLEKRVSALKYVLLNSKHSPQEITLLMLDDMASNQKFQGKYAVRDLSLAIRTDCNSLRKIFRLS